MRVENVSKHTLLCERAEYALNFFMRLRGLLGRKSFDNGEGMWIEPCSSIHTFFMHFPIDVLFLSQDNTVLKAKENLRPFRLELGVRRSKKVLELPCGVIQKTQTCVGDQLSYQV
ncbi:MAG: DUF192 domain-containing protein [Bdellovibrionales bacterium]|nr:DUF192 domain-containing protein [Bdellovibrionales bacterium]